MKCLSPTHQPGSWWFGNVDLPDKPKARHGGACPRCRKSARMDREPNYPAEYKECMCKFCQASGLTKKANYHRKRR